MHVIDAEDEVVCVIEHVRQTQLDFVVHLWGAGVVGDLGVCVWVGVGVGVCGCIGDSVETAHLGGAGMVGDLGEGVWVYGCGCGCVSW